MIMIIAILLLFFLFFLICRTGSTEEFTEKEGLLTEFLKLLKEKDAATSNERTVTQTEGQTP